MVTISFELGFGVGFCDFGMDVAHIWLIYRRIEVEV
jgi:hypothetical protein